MLMCDREVTIREFIVEDIPLKVEWINDPANNEFLHYNIPLEYEKTLAWFFDKNDAQRLDCTIEYENRPVGLIGLVAIDRNSRKAEFYISMGDTSVKRRGIGTRATQLMLQYAFDTLQLNKVYLNVDAENKAACHMYEKVGFVCEGYFRQDLMHRGRLVDRKRYAILRRDFNEYPDSELRHAQ